MPRPNTGPRFFVDEKRGGFYYIAWTEGGRSRIRSTATRDRREAEKVFGEFLLARVKKSGPCDPAETLVTGVLDDYAEAKADSPAAARIGYAMTVLSHFWEGKTVADVHDGSCSQYAKQRRKSSGTVRRELTVLVRRSILP